MNNLPRNKKIFITGHKGMVGAATKELFIREGFSNIVIADRSRLDLLDQAGVHRFFEEEQPEIVILIAAKVGGIQANIQNPATFLHDNLVIQNNVIHAAYQQSVEKLVFLGSSCIYPRECPQPMKEEYLLTGKLEPTNEGYAIAKIAGIKLLEGYYKQYGFNSISLMPCNLYGPNDSFDLNHSHVLSALVRRFVDATEQHLPQVMLWGTGVARRELMHVSDMARAILYFLEHYESHEFINIGWGEDISIKELATLIASKTGYTGTLAWDVSKPDGMLRKCMDVSRMQAAGFAPIVRLEQGVEEMITLYKAWRENNPVTL